MTTRYLTDATGNIFTVVDVGGFLMPFVPGTTDPGQTKARFEYIRDFKCREDDVVLLSYPKTGTNWLNEVIMMLLNKSTEKQIINKGKTMMEFQTQESVDTVTSPRCINTHVPFKYIPKELKEKKLRTVLVVRNPKDTLVSMYNHVKGMRVREYGGDWKDFFQLYMKGEMMLGMYWDYLKGFEKVMAADADFPMHMVYYEDLKLHGLEEVKKLAKFLGVDADEELCQKIIDKCSFEAMKNRDVISKETQKQLFKDGFHFFRKGQIGDWKNWFTVAQNEQFNKVWGKEMADSSINFIYTQTH